jgi:hypothetical protein
MKYPEPDHLVIEKKLITGQTLVPSWFIWSNGIYMMVYMVTGKNLMHINLLQWPKNYYISRFCYGLEAGYNIMTS